MKVMNAPVEIRGRPVVTHVDAMRLRFLVTALNAGNVRQYSAWLRRLDRLVKTAKVMASETIAPDVVTMNSVVRLRDIDTRRCADMELVFPSGAGPVGRCHDKTRRVSVLSPLGLAVLGRAAGHTIYGRLLIDTVLYQPEAAGEYEL